MKNIKTMGYKVKLDSNGTNPEVLKEVQKQKLADYIAMDIKAPLRKYHETVMVPVDTKKIEESIALLMNGDTPYEFRTTIVKSLLSIEDFREIGETIRGAKEYYLQKFVPTKILDLNFMHETSYNDEELNKIQMMMLDYVDQCNVR